MDLKQIKTHSQASKIILKVMIVGIIVNIVLVGLKFSFGLFFDNIAVLSDAAHSATDLVTSIAVIFTVFLSSPKRDSKHNYGHEKVEPLMLLFFALFIAGIGVLLVWQGITGIISPQAAQFNWFLVGATVISILFKEALFWYGIYYAKKIKSDLLKADAWHSRSDSLASIAVLIGLVFSIFLSTDIAESIAVLLVSILIFKVALDIFIPAVKQLTDTAASEKTCQLIKDTTLQLPEVLSVKSLSTRMFGNKIYVDLVIQIDGNLSAKQACTIASRVHDLLEAKEELQIKHCTVGIALSEENNNAVNEKNNIVANKESSAAIDEDSNNVDNEKSSTILNE
ncbi:MAG: cation diffusion facilitator family transporter [Firmicutes bacterium]|nr:cation diffusion facilitator family transporter [Bacillota bacterium]